jgi:hypothetical protein
VLPGVLSRNYLAPLPLLGFHGPKDVADHERRQREEPSQNVAAEATQRASVMTGHRHQDVAGQTGQKEEAEQDQDSEGHSVSELLVRLAWVWLASIALYSAGRRSLIFSLEIDVLGVAVGAITRDLVIRTVTCDLVVGVVTCVGAVAVRVAARRVMDVAHRGFTVGADCTSLVDRPGQWDLQIGTTIFTTDLTGVRKASLGHVVRASLAV